MLGPIRKFSTTIYAKVLLAIVILPFVFWGMGGVFSGGNKNIIVTIDDDKFSIQAFAKFIERSADENKKITSEGIDNLLTFFISGKIIDKEVKELGININDVSLSKLIKNEKIFQRDGIFSRTEYEKFLITNNITAKNFENNFLKLQKKKQLLEFIGKGLVPTKSLINVAFNEINQKRNLEIINLNNYFEKRLNFTDEEINNFFNKNNDKFNELYKSINLIELSPKALIDSEEYNDLFFSLIDEIDDLITKGENLDFLINKFNLEKQKSFFINREGKDLNLKKIDDLENSLLEEIFNVNDSKDLLLVEKDNKYFIIDIISVQEVKRKVTDVSVKKNILEMMKKDRKREINAELVTKINKDNFLKSDFDKLAIEENLKIKKVNLKNANDTKVLKKALVSQIYSFSKKEVVLVNDLNLLENYLLYINKIENVSIDENSNDYEKYSKLSRVKTTSKLYNTYDNYIKTKYKININYEALEGIKNNFN